MSGRGVLTLASSLKELAWLVWEGNCDKTKPHREVYQSAKCD
jgi:hypothetical protein